MKASAIKINFGPKSMIFECFFRGIVSLPAPEKNGDEIWRAWKGSIMINERSVKNFLDKLFFHGLKNIKKYVVGNSQNL